MAIANFFCSSCHLVVAIENLSLSCCHHVTCNVSLFCSSCHHVKWNFWARVLCNLAAEDACFRMRITLGVFLICSLVFHICVRNVPRTVPECVRICWFKRNSSNLDRAPKMRDAFRLNSWNSFLVTLPSISSETCMIYSLLNLGTNAFRYWPFLGCSSCVSLVTAGNFNNIL